MDGSGARGWTWRRVLARGASIGNYRAPGARRRRHLLGPAGASLSMNVILILIDSLNRHHLTAYGPSAVATPSLEAFARKAWRFDNHFVGSLPCMPARREIFSGFKELMWRPWGPLEAFDARLPKLLEAGGYSTAIVTDHYHYWEESANGYLQSFQSAETIRGHELDFWKSPIQDDEP